MTGGWIIPGANEFSGAEDRAQGEEQRGVGVANLRIYEKAYGNLLVSELVSKHKIFFF